jgi:hypothetical protein
MMRRVGLRNWKIEIGNWSHRMTPASYQFPFSSFFSRLAGQLEWLIVAAMALGSARMTYAQGCAMCYTSAAAAKKAGIEALRSGILILLVPPLVIFAGIIWLTYRSRNSFNGHGAEPQEDWREEPPQFAPGPPGGFEEEPVLAEVGDPLRPGRHLDL